MAAYKKLEEVSTEDISAAGVPPREAARVNGELRRILQETQDDAEETWRRVSSRVLRPEHPFPLHQMMFYGCYKDYGSDTPAWIPDPDTAFSTNIGRLLQRCGKEFLGPGYKDPISSFLDFQRFSASNPQCAHLYSKRRQFTPWGQWLPGAVLNAAGNCLNLNGKRRLDDVVIIWRDEGYDSSPVNHITLNELRTEVRICCCDRHANDFTAVVIYLAIVAAGYVVVSIADSFAPIEISTRVKISNAKAIFTQDYIVRGDKNIPLYSRVVDADSPSAIVVPTKGFSFSRKLRDGDISWHDFLERAKNSKIKNYAVDAPVEAFTNILFSSGTTGEPKAIPWTHATPLKAAADAWSHMDIRKGDVVAWPTNLGWMMGPWLVYATLINGASMALYNGSPLGHGFAKFVQDAKVTMLGVVPSIVRTWKNTNCSAGLIGLPFVPLAYGRAHYKPVIEYCGGTEIGGAFVSGSLLQSQSLSSFSTPAMGCTLLILGSDGNPLPQGAPGIGELALFPTMLGASTTLLNADHYNVYFRGMPVWNGKTLRRHGDEFERTTSGYYRAHGRADDTMNLGGIKVSSVEIERICNEVDGNVLETAAIGVPPLGGGPEQLVVVVVFKEQKHSEETLGHLKAAFNSSLQKKLNPLFRASSVVAVPALPRTASNKVMRRLLKQQFVQRNQVAKL
ncbi:unnamed protein product [Spirodela intermedia]|uniref:4-coumarate--CoA ligase n=1 Tax=Spirodela intermedia TaxID=51605 RepID=A0A7I8JKJ0_SPIIN|nr:unnamed protein product [Spirodela intermedia]CAA6670649.1 unnamed protein product [Spirodela intermedia]